ncbi:MAG: hypothetical protein HLUCCA01_03165 [Bacteroidetes bacterium HLUCCA01]|nr:MAG: hypothetical protein HLUCCA01_03165 [Bacteroidetes bacterium HLUCCA01]
MLLFASKTPRKVATQPILREGCMATGGRRLIKSRPVLVPDYLIRVIFRDRERSCVTN